MIKLNNKFFLLNEFQVGNGMYDFLENEKVYWENTTHATDLFGERAVQIIERQVRQV
jgi:hypothetical protein